METRNNTHGKRIRSLLETATKTTAVIAPFIKVSALQSLINAIPSNVHIRCVTRWHPHDVAAGVSDPEILNILQNRGNFSLSLVDRLHAKIYIADDKCLAGSSNVTLAGLGEGHDNSNNIEVLIETSVNDTSIVETLEKINAFEREATSIMATTVRQLAEALPPTEVPEKPWYPLSRIPEQAFQFYTEIPIKHVKASEHNLIADLARANIQPGLDEKTFRDEICSLLADMPTAKFLLETPEDVTLRQADIQPQLALIANNEFSADDLWISFVNWMSYFFSDRLIKQEITEVALRSAKAL